MKKYVGYGEVAFPLLICPPPTTSEIRTQKIFADFLMTSVGLGKIMSSGTWKSEAPKNYERWDSEERSTEIGTMNSAKSYLYDIKKTGLGIMEESRKSRILVLTCFMSFLWGTLNLEIENHPPPKIKG